MIRAKPMILKLAAFVMGSIAVANIVVARVHSAQIATLSSALVSDYFFRGQRLGGPSLQPAVDLNVGEFNAGISAIIPLNDKVANQSVPEFDFYASHHFSLKDKWRLIPGIAFYGYPHAPAGAGYQRSIFEPSIALTYTVAGLRITSTCYYDITRRGPTFELAGAVALPLTTLGTEVDLAASVGDYRLRDAFRNAAPTKRLSGNYWSLGASVPFQITSTSSIRIGVAYTSGFHSHIKQGASPRTVNPLTARRTVAQCGYSLSF